MKKVKRVSIMWIRFLKSGVMGVFYYLNKGNGMVEELLR